MTREYIVQVSDAIITDAFGRFEKEWSPDDLVRCKDCWKRPYDNCPFNEHLYYQPEDDFFCGDGERSQVTVK